MITRRYLPASTAAIPGTPCLAFAEDVMRLRAEPVNPDPIEIFLLAPTNALEIIADATGEKIAVDFPTHDG